MRLLLKITTIAIIMLFYNPVFSAVNSQSLFEQGIKAFTSGNYGSSELLFRKLIDNGSDEHRDRAWFHLAMSIFHQKKYKSAIFEFNRFLLICTTNELCSRSRYWIAESHFLLKKYIKSIEEFKRFISASKDKSMIHSAHVRIGDIYFIQSRYDEAIIEWERARDKKVDEHKNSLLLLKIGEAYFLNKNYDGVLKLLEPLILSERDIRIEARARLLIGRVYQLKNNHKRALRAFRGIPDTLNREDPYYDAQYFRAMSLLAIGDLSSARFQLEAFILIGMDSEWYYEAKYELGRIIIKLGKERRGIELLEEVRNSTSKMELRSKSALVLSKIFSKKNPEDAIPYLEDSASLNDPAEQKNVLLLLGNAYIEARRFEDAERILELIMETYPYENDIDQVQFLLSRVYLEKGNIEKAVEGFKKVKELNPFSKYINESLFYLALAHYRNHNEELALEFIKKYLAFKKTEKRYDAYSLLLNIYLARNDVKNSKKVIKIIVKDYSYKRGVDAIIYEFATSIPEKRYRKKYLNLIITKYPASVSAGKVYLLWGDIAFKDKDYKKAELYYRRYLRTKGRENAGSVFLFRSISLYRQGKFKEVISLLTQKELPEMNKYTSRQLLLWKGRSYYHIENYQRAYETLLNWELKDLSLDDILIVSRSSIQLGNLKMAKRSAEFLRENKKLYAESLYFIGQYYLREREYDIAKSYFLSILFECPESEYVDFAKSSIAELYIQNGRFIDAIQKLNEIKNKKLDDKKIALLIISHFKIDRVNIAAELTEKNLKVLSRSPYGEIVFKESVRYYYNDLDLKKFKKYSKYLKRYKGNENLINYLTGILYFNLNKYSSSYYFFYKLAQVNSKYRHEALYYLGLISYFKHKNPNLARSYFNKLIQSKNLNNKYTLQARVNLSILLKETGKIDLSKKYLSEIINTTDNKLLFIQAKNLYEYFGYSE
jgi:tetratricopeptide (TPR) repeat protein